MVSRILLGSFARAFAALLFLWSAGRLVIAAGHGAGFLYTFVLQGELHAWVLCQMPAWVALAAEVVAIAAIQKPIWHRIASFAIGAALVSVVLFVLRSETLHILGEEIDRVITLAAVAVLRIYQVVYVKRQNA